MCAASPTQSSIETMYEGIPVSTLVVDTIVPFDLFTTIDDAAILYRAAGDSYTREVRRSFRETGISELYVRRADRDKYYEYLGSNVRSLLCGVNGDPPDPTEVHDISVMATGRAIETPQSKPAFQLASEVIDNAIVLTTKPGGVLSCIQAGTPGLKRLRAHSMRVCFYGLQLARGLGIEDPSELNDLGVGLMLHDLGKVEANGEEISTDADLRNHPILGVGRVETLEHVGEVARDVIEHHHERIDGQGRYQIAGAELSIHARIASVSNAFDRRTVDAEGRSIMNSFDALRAMIAEEQGAYDPKLLALFVRSLSL